jgi:GNAT superfamily N-acetyltransferase
MDASRPDDALARVAAYLQATSSDRERVGPFAVGFTPHTSNPMLNYAVPVPGADPTAADIAALIEAFTSRGLLPRLEYLPVTAPAVEPALAAAGFTVERRPTVMACAGVAEVPVPAGVSLGLATDRDAFAEVAAVQHRAYGEPAPPSEHDLDRMARFVGRGGRVGLARSGALVVAGAHLAATTEGVAELAAVATDSEHRGRGIATALSRYLTGVALDGGADLVWLEPEGEAEQRMYARVGYREVGAKLYLSRKE